MNVVYLGRRKAVQLKAGIFRMQRPQQIFVPLDIKIGMQPALHQHAGAAERDRLVDPLADLFDRMHVSVRLAGPAIERAERADDVAHVGVIDVAVDDVGDDVASDSCRMRISSAARPMRTKSCDSSSAVQSSLRQPLARQRLIQNRLNIIGHLSIILPNLCVFSARYDARIASGGWMAARIRMRPRQRGHSRTSNPTCIAG